MADVTLPSAAPAPDDPGAAARQRALLDGIPAVVYEADPDDPAAVTVLGAAIETMVGAPLATVLGDPRGWLRYVHADDRAHVERAIAAAVDDRGPFRCEYRLVHARTGEATWVQDEGRWVPAEGRAGPVLRGVLLDVTARKRAEAALADREQKYRTLFDTMDQGFCVIEVLFDDAQRAVDYRFLEVNRTFTAQTGLDEPVGRTARELVPGLERHWFERYGAVARSGEPARFEQGSEAMGRWFEVHAYRVGVPAAHQVAILFTDVSARRRAELALRESERRFREMADHAPVMMWVTDADGACTFLNRPWREFTGQDDAAGLGYGWLEAVHPDDRAASERVFRAATADRAPFRLDYRLRRADGAYRWCIDAAAPRRSETGGFLGFVGSVVDVHDRREAEAALRRSYAELEAVYRAAPVGLAVFDVDLRWVRINERLAEINGLPVEAHLGRRPSELLGALGAHAEALLGEIVRTGEPRYDLELVGETPAQPGVERAWVEQWIPIRGAEGSVVGISIVAEEITERRRQALERERLLAAEQASRQRTERLQTLAAALSAARTLVEVAEATLHAGVRAVGAPRGSVLRLADGGATLEMLAVSGYADDEIAPWRRFPNTPTLPVGAVVASRAPLVIGRRAEYLARFPGLADWITRTGYHGAAIFPLVAGASPSAPVLGAVAFDYDADHDFGDDELAFLGALAELCAQAFDRALAYEAAERARDDAEAANRSKSEFLTSMSHELRTPLNAIQGHVQLMEMELHGPVTDAQRGALGRVQRAQQHLLGLINDVLNFAKLEAGKVEYHIGEVDLGELLPDVAAMLAPQMHAAGLTFHVQPPATPCLVWADREKLAQVLLNLLSNAVKFTPAGGTVWLDAQPVPEVPVLMRVRVRDTGIGIPADKLEAVFAPFVQVSAGRTRTHDGTGLGLAISRDLARGMGGDLAAESALGAGATFTVALRRMTTTTGEPVDRRARDERRTEGDRRTGADRRGAEPRASGG